MATVSRTGTLIVRVKMDGVRETLAAFKELDKNASKELRDETVKIADDLADRMRRAAIADGNQSVLMAPTVKPRRDRVVTVVAGGGKRVGRYKKPAGALIFSSEFGQNKKSGWYARPRYRNSLGRQYHPQRGAASYWFFKTYEESQSEIYRRWFAVVDRLLAKWGRGG